jgi:hypothetical protein
MKTSFALWKSLLILFAVLLLQGCPILGGKNDSGNDGDGNNNGVHATPTPTASPTPGPGPGNQSARDYFNNTVKVDFNSKCQSCHNHGPFESGAKDDIFDYSSALNYLSEGTAANDNAIYNSARGMSPHTTSGDLCPAGADQLCNDIQHWYDLEDITVGNVPTSGPRGTFVGTFTGNGTFRGWAVDPGNTNASVTVSFYTGPMGTGTLIGSTMANAVIPPSGLPGNHGFSYTLPDSYKDGTSKTLYAYFTPLAGGAPVMITGSPKTYKIYLSKQAAVDYYNNTLKAGLQSSCGGCHDNGASFMTADNFFLRVAESTTPPFGATATNHIVIQKAMGVDHNGGQRCTAGTSPCNLMINWWNLQFGP